jgi:bacillopeptidase F
VSRIALTTIALLAVLPGTAAAATLSPSLEQRVAALAPHDVVPVILDFRDGVDLARHPRGRAAAPELVTALRDRAARGQARVLAFLRARPSATAIRPLWINHALAVRVPSAMLSELLAFPEVESIDYDEPVRFEEPAASAGVGGSVDWSLAMIEADQVWTTYGLDGTGIVVGSMDTGFDPLHPALQSKWRGGANSWIDIINGLPAPYDDHGHGTHTIGTMVGGDGPGPGADDIGVAPSATFISAKVLDQNNSFSSASIVIAGAQWMLDPDGNPLTDDFPHVINNSWFFNSQTYSGFSTTVDAWRAAGIVPVFCLANFGPGASTTRPPGNYANTLGVGATNSSDLIASFSSRGPSPAGAVFPADTRKPEISAPGQSVRSSIPGGGYQNWNGTSMAAPHVAGTVALMLQGNPNLDLATIRAQLIGTAVDRGAAGYDFDYGYGRLDAFAATTAAVAGVETQGGPGVLRLQVEPNPSRGPVRFAHGGGSAASIAVFDLAGRRVWSASVPGTSGGIEWDGRDRDGRMLPAGVYVVRLADGPSAVSRRVLRLN